MTILVVLIAILGIAYFIYIIFANRKPTNETKSETTTITTNSEDSGNSGNSLSNNCIIDVKTVNNNGNKKAVICRSGDCFDVPYSDHISTRCINGQAQYCLGEGNTNCTDF